MSLNESGGEYVGKIRRHVLRCQTISGPAAVSLSPRADGEMCLSSYGWEKVTLVHLGCGAGVRTSEEESGPGIPVIWTAMRLPFR